MVSNRKKKLNSKQIKMKTEQVTELKEFQNDVIGEKKTMKNIIG